jgi:hypothetical protein
VSQKKILNLNYKSSVNYTKDSCEKNVPNHSDFEETQSSNNNNSNNNLSFILLLFLKWTMDKNCHKFFFTNAQKPQEKKPKI